MTVQVDWTLNSAQQMNVTGLHTAGHVYLQCQTSRSNFKVPQTSESALVNQAAVWIKLSLSFLMLNLPAHLTTLFQLEGQLKTHLDKAFAAGTWTTNSRTITNSWIRDGLKPRCISRDLKWGTPIPLEGYKDKVSEGNPVGLLGQGQFMQSCCC